MKFMGLMSGHGETRIVGKPSLHLSPLKLVLWSWTKDEVEKLCEKLGPGAPTAHAYAVCGGSVRFLFKPDDEAGVIPRSRTRIGASGHGKVAGPGFGRGRC